MPQPAINRRNMDIKMIRNVIIRIICTTFIILASPCLGSDSKFQLSSEEQTWLNKNHTVRVRIGNSPPFMFTDGEIRGIAIDYLTNIFNRNGLKFHYIKQSEVTWPQALKYIEQHDVVDMVPTAKITNERKKHMLFTNEYIFAPWVIFTKSDADFVSSIEDLNGKTVSVEEGYVIHEKLKQEYPGIKLKVVSAKLQNSAGIPLRDLSTGLVDAYIGNLLSTTYLIQLNGYTNVKVAAPTSFDDHNQAMAIRNDWPELISIINKTLSSMTPEEHAAIRNRWLSVRYEYGINNADIIKWILSIIVAASFIIGFVLIWNRRLKTEVAHRKEIEESLLKSDKKYRQIFYTNKAIKLIIDPHNGTIVEANEAACSYYGYSIKELMALNISDINVLPPEDILLEMQNAKTENRLYFNFSHRLASGEERDVEVYSGPLILGEKTLLYSIVHDVTDRKQAEEALRESEKQLKMVLDGSQLGFWDWNIETNVVHRNERWAKMLGYTLQELEINVKQWTDLNHPEDRAAASKSIQDHLGGWTSSHNIEYRMRTKDGDYKWILDQAKIVKYDDHGKPLRMCGTHTDITEHKKIEKQLQQSQKMESIGNLAGGIAHDFNNILSSVIGFTELALDEVEKETTLEDSLQEVYAAGKRAKDLVKQILAFARQSDEKLKPIQVDLIVKEVLQFIRSSIPTTIEIKQNIESESLIIGNSTQIHQVLMNLFTNAAHAMEDEGGILEMSLKDVVVDSRKMADTKVIKPGDYIEIKVSDTGAGISPVILESIFDPYFTTKPPGEGTGMGLAMVHGIVESYGGEITVNSILGKGTVFTLYLPITRKRKVQRPYESVELPTGTERILFVDDEAPITKMGSQGLERSGYTVTIRTSSVEALDLFKSKPNDFDLVITDMTMPNMTGDKLAIELMKIRADIPVILCTGYSKKISEESAAEIGIKAFAYKPLVKADLANTVRKVLNEAKGEPLDTLFESIQPP
jgi:PAS domain S-box-containing protein